MAFWREKNKIRMSRWPNAAASESAWNPIVPAYHATDSTGPVGDRSRIARNEQYIAVAHYHCKNIFREMGRGRKRSERGYTDISLPKKTIDTS